MVDVVADARNIDSPIRIKIAADLAIADLAGRQHGVVARFQLTRLGLGARAIHERRHSGRLHDIHRGVYVRDGIPVTTVPRTLLDLAAVVTPHRLERAVHEAEVLRLSDKLSLLDLAAATLDGRAFRPCAWRSPPAPR